MGWSQPCFPPGQGGRGGDAGLWSERWLRADARRWGSERSPVLHPGEGSVAVHRGEKSLAFLGSGVHFWQLNRWQSLFEQTGAVW